MCWKATENRRKRALNGLDDYKDYALVEGGVLCSTESESIINKLPPSRSRSPETPSHQTKDARKNQ